jgi:hypothetical protein
MNLQMFYWLVFKFLLSRFLKQGFNHKNNLVNIHRAIQDQLASEFSEVSEASRENLDFQCRTKAWSRI